MIGEIADLHNIVNNWIEKASAGRHVERHGLVTSYDDKNHLAKVMLKPEDFETGWLEMEVAHAGAGHGILSGLVTGDGKTTGDQVVVRFQEGEVEAGKVVKRLHDKDNKPPQVKSNEQLWQNFKGHHLFFKDDGSTRFAFNTSGNTPQGGEPPPSDNVGSFKFDKDGNQTADSNKKTQIVTDSNGATQTHDGNGNYSHQAKTIAHTATDADISRTANSGNIIDTAQTLLHNGPTNVNGTLGVSQLLSANGGLSGTGSFNWGSLISLANGMAIGGGLTSSAGTSLGGGAAVSGGLTTDTLKTTPSTVATLPSAAGAGAGVRSFVTDATATTFGTTVAGGGTNKVPVWCDGTNWKIG